jgi:hypothetical protein
MITSLIFARIIGTIALVGGLEVILNRKSMSNAISAAVENGISLWIVGLIALILGATIVALHNVWVYDWRLIITIVGWSSILKGVVIMLLPDFAKTVYRKCNTPGVLVPVGFLVIVLSLILLYCGIRPLSS